MNDTVLYELKLHAAYQIYVREGYPADEMIEADGFIVWAARKFPAEFSLLCDRFEQAVKDVLL